MHKIHGKIRNKKKKRKEKKRKKINDWRLLGNIYLNQSQIIGKE